MTEFWWLIGVGVHVGLCALCWRLAVHVRRLERELLGLRGKAPEIPTAWLL